MLNWLKVMLLEKLHNLILPKLLVSRGNTCMILVYFLTYLSFRVTFLITEVTKCHQTSNNYSNLSSECLIE